MSRVLVSTLLLLFLTTAAVAQPEPGSPPQISLQLTLSTGAKTFDDMHFGLDMRATDGYDSDSGLQEDPNLPPANPGLEGRFIRVTTDKKESFRDYRFTDGSNQTVKHYFKIKKADSSDDDEDEVKISWNLPGYASGVLKDGNTEATISAMSGSGSTSINNNIAGDPAITLFLMEIQYTNIPKELLPVELTSFTALVQEGQAVLRWETASELNNAGFEVQQLVEGSFQTIGFVDGAGTTNEAQTYSFRTGTLAAGQHDFRLKQIDFDGTFAYSDVASVDVSFAGAAVMQAAHPNPFNPQTQFSLTIAQEQKVTLHVYDMLGRQVQTLYQGILAPSEAHRFTFEAGNLPSGRYFIRAVGQYFTKSQTVTLLK